MRRTRRLCNAHMPDIQRSSLNITLAVWRALLLREALSRLFGKRTAWVWLLLEPAVHMAFLVFVFVVIRVRHVGGIDTTLWLLAGLLAFFFFRRTGTAASNAVGANAALYTYRQVKPVDTVLVRAALEGVLMVVVAALILAAAAVLGVDVMPDDPLGILAAVFGLWLLGLGFGLVVSVIKELSEDMGNVVGLAMMPLYLLSGVIMPLSIIPYPYQEWLLFNPIAHGLEAVRLGFAPYYHAVQGLSLAYLYEFALVLLFFGLALHARFAQRLVTR